jgi:hypothetical protein
VADVDADVMTAKSYRAALLLIERMLNSRMDDEAVSRAKALINGAGKGLGLIFRADRSV